MRDEVVELAQYKVGGGRQKLQKKVCGPTKSMAGYLDMLKSEHAMNLFGRQLSKREIAYSYPSITIIDGDVREKTDTRC